MIKGVRKIIIPVDDQQRAKRFWTEQVGFTVARDETYGDERWVEVQPPDQQLVLVLTPRGDEPRREVRDQLPHSDVFFTCDDIRQTHQELSARGVRFPTEPTELPIGWWAMFEDDCGTSYALGQYG